MADFVHLHVHSEFSLLDGLSKIPKLVLQTKVLGMKHLALTDHGGLYGAIKFYEECKKEGINPIVGCEMYMAGSSLNAKKSPEDKETYHLTVLARDVEGYRNLMKMVSIAHLEGFYYRPRIDKETLAKYSKGLIVLSGCNSSEVSRALVAGDIEKAKKGEVAKEELKHGLEIFLKLLHPFMPFVTEAVWQELGLPGQLILQPWPVTV